MGTSTVKELAHAALVLENGATMNADEFHELYASTGSESRFELVDGIVHMAPPLHDPHGSSSNKLQMVTALYEGMTPGVIAHDGTSVRLDALNEVQPDCLIRVDDSCGGQSRVLVNDRGERTIIQGAPEFVAEVAYSSRSIDFGRKLEAYLRAGVREYLIVNLADGQLSWFELPTKTLIQAGDDGVLRSRVLPGLWIDAVALLEQRVQRCVDVLKLAGESDEHEAFCNRLEEVRRQS